MKKIIIAFALYLLFLNASVRVYAQCPLTPTDLEKLLTCNASEFKLYAEGKGYSMQGNDEVGMSFRCNTPKDTLILAVNDQLQKLNANEKQAKSVLYMTTDDAYNNEFCSALLNSRYKLKGTETKDIEEMMNVPGNYSYYNNHDYSITIIKVPFFLTIYEYIISEKMKK